MITGKFRLGGDLIDVVVDENNILYGDSGGTITSIGGLKLSKAGVIREHPDLKDDDEWRKKAIERLKEHTGKMKTETEKLNYIKKELEKYGYEAQFKQRAGFRPQKF